MDQFDLIIVGSGTAGSVLAERLTASGRQSVLLLEAGGRPASMFVGMPAGFSKLFKSKFDWAFQSAPQAAAGGRTIFIPRGRMLGGTANMNAQIHHWCHPADFESWVAAGATGWGWEDVAPVFAAQECWLGPAGTRQRGRTGPLLVSPNRSVHPLSHAFLAAARTALGCADGDDDYNAGDCEGAWLCQLSQRKGRRYSAYNAFLEPALSRSNLRTVTGAHVTRILFEDGRAAGVVAREGGRERRYGARACVIIAAGAFGSPQLLMLSGIGPAGTLRQYGIPVLHDAPEVGANLQDHASTGILFRTPRTDTYSSAETFGNLLRYLILRRGMLTSNVAEAFVFTRTRPTLKGPDLELLFLPLEWRDEGLTPPTAHAFSIAAIAIAPRSRGHVTLNSSDPLAPPAIDLGLLSDADGVDEAVLLAGIRLIRQVAATPPLVDDVLDEAEPGEQLTDDLALRAWINTRLQTLYHPTSTCRMGSDERAVVDHRLRVRGVKGLWIADASVMPMVPRGHPNAVVAMIAQRAAEWITAATPDSARVSGYPSQLPK